jgi:DNA-binding MarR family transcriptional regulator
VRRISRLDAGAERAEAVAAGLVDAVLARDGATLAACLDALRDAQAGGADDDPRRDGWIEAAIAFAYWGLERVPSQPPVAHGTQAHAFLTALDGRAQTGSAELRSLLAVDETQVSRTGHRLLESGLVARRKIGRQVFWQLTPRGRRALEDSPAPSRSANSDFWQQAIRRGYDGDPAEVDPLRAGIVESALKLHQTLGIRATTWAQVAEAAAVPMDTVRSLFPDKDDLYRSCGAHLMESLRLPPADRAPDVFAGAGSLHERTHRLVDTFFGVYERGADGLTAGRRERSEVAVVDESMVEVDRTFDAIVREALRPLGGPSSSVASVRALTDLEVWRAWRDQGATPRAAVERASGTVERWLEAHAGANR